MNTQQAFARLVDGQRKKISGASGGRISRQWVDSVAIGRRGHNPLDVLLAIEVCRGDGLVGDVVAELLGGAFTHIPKGSGNMGEAIGAALSAMNLSGQTIARLAEDVQDGRIDELEEGEHQIVRLIDTLLNLVGEIRALKKGAEQCCP